MVKRLVALFVCFLMVFVLFSTYSPASLSQEKVESKSPKTVPVPIGFIENKGQWDREFAFLGRTPFGQIGLATSKIYFYLPGPKKNPDYQVIQLSLDGANQVAPVGIDPYPTNYHFYMGRDQSKWVTNAKMYQSIKYPDIYQGIDLYYLMSGKNPKYEFHVSPGADPSVIKFSVLGADIQADAQVLRYITPGHTLNDSGLYVFEKQSKKQVISTFLASPKNSFGFQVGEYDKEQTLIIDPVLGEVYLSGTGSYEDNEGLSEALDSDGNLYITGYSSSMDFPITPGVFKPFDPSPGSQNNAFVSKIDNNGILAFSLVIASNFTSYDNVGCAITLTSQNEIVIAGITNAPDFPVTSGAFQSSLKGGYDFFLCKFNTDGTQLLMSTLIGGTSDDLFDVSGSSVTQVYYSFNCNNPIFIGPDDSITISGNTYSSDFPLTSGSLKSSNTSYNNQIVLFTMNSAGTTLLYSTYFGGSMTDGTLALIGDEQNNIYIAGFTFSFDFFTTPGAYQESVTMNGMNGFVAKFHNDPVTHLITPVFSTILGDQDTFVNSIDYDLDNNIIAAGTTYSFNFPTSEGALFDARIDSWGNSDIFVATLSESGSSLRYATYMGGDNEDTVASIYVDHSGFTYVAGTTRSGDFPTTGDAFFDTPVSWMDMFVFRIYPTMDALSFSTFYNADIGTMGIANDIIVTEDNLVYLLGSYYFGGGFSPNLPYMYKPYQMGYSYFPSSGQVIVGINFTIPLVFPGDPSLSLSASNNTFTLDWSAVTGDNPLSGFVLYRSVDGGPFLYWNDFGPLTLQAVDSDIASGTNYRYFMDSYDNQGNYSGLSNTVSYTKPSPPASPSTSTSDSAIIVSWVFSTPGSASVQKYLCYRSEDALFSSPTMVGFVASNQSYYKDTNATIGTTYYYKVVASDLNGIDSFPSAMVSGVAVASLPVLSLSAGSNKSEFEKGDSIILKLYIHNLNSTKATNVILTMQLPEDLDFVSVENYGSFINGKVVTFPIGTINGLTYKEVNIICQVKGQVNADTSAVIGFVATCAENVFARTELNFVIKARKTTTSAVSVTVQVQNTEQDPVTGKKFIKFGDPLVVTYEILGGSCPYTVYVDWGDGTKEKIEIKCFQELQGVLKHTYTARGTYHIKLKIEDASGQSKNSDFDMEIR